MVAPASGVIITFDYKVELDPIGTGDGSTKTFNLECYPVIPYSETIYLDGNPQQSSSYNFDYDNGVLTFLSGPSNGSKVQAAHTCYTVDQVTVLVGIAASGEPINMAPGRLILSASTKIPPTPKSQISHCSPSVRRMETIYWKRVSCSKSP